MSDTSPFRSSEPPEIEQEPPNVTEAVENTLRAIPYDRTHDALIRLAREYAREIDDGDVEVLSKLGPKLESVCVRLGVKPLEARGGGSERGNALAEWRNRRAN